MKETKLHEILAVEDSVNTVLKDALNEAMNSFANKQNLFMGHTVTVQPLEQDESSGGAAIESESITKDVAETVTGKLKFVTGHLIKSLNVYGQKERTNQDARADLVVGGDVLIADAPATMLIGLETKLKAFRAMCGAIKTSDQSMGWKATQQKNVYAARELEAFTTKKVQRERVVIEPTQHQAGQFTVFTEDVRVGKKTTVHTTGLIGPKEKSDLLGRIDNLIRGARKARQKANAQVVDTKFRIGKLIANYILSDVVLEDE